MLWVLQLIKVPGAFKKIIPHPLFHSHSPCTSSMSASPSSLPLPNETPASAWAEVEVWTLGLALPVGKPAAFHLFSEIFIYLLFMYLFYFIFPPTSPMWPLRWKERVKPFLSLLVLTFQLPSHFSWFSPFHPVSPDFSHDVVHALIGPKYHKHHQTHLFSKRQLHATNYMVHLECRASSRRK